MGALVPGGSESLAARSLWRAKRKQTELDPVHTAGPPLVAVGGFWKFVSRLFSGTPES
jgi:hypothetical protein